jgi:hypothetical protein
MRARLLLVLCCAACEGPPGGSPPPPNAQDLAQAPPDDGGQPAMGSGWVRVQVLDDESGLPMPARVVVTAVGTTPAVRFDNDPFALQIVCQADQECPAGDYCSYMRCTTGGLTAVALSPGVLGAPEGVLLVGGDGSFRVPAGTYDVTAFRGPDWEDATERLTVTDHANASVAFSLRHSVDTRGWVSADLHVHTARSYDSRIQVEDRVVTEVAAGVQLIVTTDHNVLSDLQPQIEMWGYHSLARAIVGDEFNFFEGHGGAYPMPYDATDPIAGGVQELKLDWDSVKVMHSADMFAFLHAFPTRPAVTVNHPWWPTTDLGYFTNLKQYGPDGWVPPTPLADAGLFDAIEVVSGYTGTPDYIVENLRRWFFLLSSGTKVTVLGSSDTHGLENVKAGFPRSWLRLPSDDPTQVTDSDLADAIKSQRAIASNGPFALLTVDGAQIGDQVTATSGSVTIDATIDAPPWIDIDTVKLYVNGQVAQSFPVTTGLRPVLHARFALPLPSTDCWIALSASGSRPLPTALIGTYSFGAVTPFVITNPVFVDVDGDGAWHPQVQNPDPGPLAAARSRGPTWFVHDRPAPRECEPPLWTDPSRWDTP